ncbi:MULTISPECIES: mechanosensitive ion channel family protein [Haloferax]|uniref:Mechanosensitive ion channel n=1 Tax=Haloferax marinum TaxID=2666143 RepID=A0A6A8G3I4_9EURY|nr:MULTISPECIES: mechanosensitive ion channel domain-containing protein [Haloferax]KAB1196123.1 mechanosensitive ion channel [Haloferax sp. CBA1150]MRW95108.1 mechanosensitive ion channel [Haloferax marinum]
MSRRLGLGSFVAGLLAAVLAGLIRTTTPLSNIAVPDADVLLAKGLSALAVVLVTYGFYRLLMSVFVARISDRRRAHDLRNVLRLTIGIVALVGVLGAFTDQWLGVLVSFGVIGFAITFALQQPILSLIGWVYVVIKRPYAVGDRVTIANVSGDVAEVDFLVTTLWETGGQLTSNQPTGRTVTVPNSLVLSSEVVNHGALFDRIWTEVPVQVSYETDIPFVRDIMLDVAEEAFGNETRAAIQRYRHRLDESPLDLDVPKSPTVNISQSESWVVLTLRVLVPPRGAQNARNHLYEGILARLDEHPDRVGFPVGRNR